MKYGTRNDPPIKECGMGAISWRLRTSRSGSGVDGGRLVKSWEEKLGISTRALAQLKVWI